MMSTWFGIKTGYHSVTVRWLMAQGRWMLGVHEAVALSLRQRSSAAFEDGVRERQKVAERGAEATAGVEQRKA
jgi:hypothetical protein